MRQTGVFALPLRVARTIVAEDSPYDQSRLPAFDRRNTGSNTFLTATYALARRTAPEVVHPTPKEMSEQTLAGLTMSSLRELVEKNEDDVKGNPAVAKRILSELNNTDDATRILPELNNTTRTTRRAFSPS
ncbi:unnamed protein product [Zymoseptoria tritici ST99CH_1E4]|uniref:Uncharacterized protein n=1 Tax=Zymoseptoria tritici ST99CH_1E4 TaxID=1276532 RepID=A0A2H1GAD5_ZYMTR|nr:unnamed protein product [Zymoseptoria tritici ST99CH_1E4]